MTAEAETALDDAGVGARDVRWSFGADLRYAGQQNEVTITFAGDPRRERDLEMVRRTFEEAYFAQYEVNPSHVPIEVVSWRLTARGPENVVEGAPAPVGAPGSAKATRSIPLWPGVGPVAIYDRTALRQGQVIKGPAIIEERETTIVLPPEWDGLVNALGCIVAERRS